VEKEKASSVKHPIKYNFDISFVRKAKLLVVPKSHFPKHGIDIVVVSVITMIAD